MNQIIKIALIGLANLGIAVAAQDWYHDREGRFRGEEWRGRLFEHVRMDLDHIGSAVWAAEREQRRLARTKQELDELQGKLAAGRYDQHELNDVIDSMRKSANDQRLAPQDRRILADDLNRLIDYRAHHANWRR